MKYRYIIKIASGESLRQKKPRQNGFVKTDMMLHGGRRFGGFIKRDIGAPDRQVGCEGTRHRCQGGTGAFCGG